MSIKLPIIMEKILYASNTIIEIINNRIQYIKIDVLDILAVSIKHNIVLFNYTYRYNDYRNIWELSNLIYINFYIISAKKMIYSTKILVIYIILIS